MLTSSLIKYNLGHADTLKTSRALLQVEFLHHDLKAPFACEFSPPVAPAPDLALLSLILALEVVGMHFLVQATWIRVDLNLNNVGSILQLNLDEAKATKAQIIQS